MKKNVAVLISGSGSNLQALMDAARTPAYPARIALVISNRPEAYGLTRAKQVGVQSLVINHKDYATREAFDAALHAALLQANIDIVCLAGFMRLLTPGFVEHWEGRMLNIHPSLLPAFKGAHAIRDALKAGTTETGCSVHLVTAELDSGPILLQEKVPVKLGDSEETLAERIHKAEHRIYPKALKMLIEKFFRS